MELGQEVHAGNSPSLLAWAQGPNSFRDFEVMVMVLLTDVGGSKYSLTYSYISLVYALDSKFSFVSNFPLT